ncbi:MAG: PAS domain-containing protein, partial [Nitrospirae bacterium]|nr:PAS domain-containing protein [Nitrospirota bacterium]
MKKSTSPGVKKPSSRPRRGRLKFMPHVAAIIDSVTDAIIAVNEEQRVVLFNPAAEKMFGYAVQAAIGQPLDRFIPERFHAAHWAHVRAFGPSG